MHCLFCALRPLLALELSIKTVILFLLLFPIIESVVTLLAQIVLITLTIPFTLFISSTLTCLFPIYFVANPTSHHRYSSNQLFISMPTTRTVRKGITRNYLFF